MRSSYYVRFGSKKKFAPQKVMSALGQKRKANNHGDAENSVHVLARYELVSHRLNPSGPLALISA